jgi:hypothetical protein
MPYRKGKLKGEKCEVCGDDYRVSLNSKTNKKLCCKHFSQINHFGKILNRTRYDKNEIEVDGEIVHLTLRDKFHNSVGVVKIDVDDVVRVKNMKWYLGCGEAKYAVHFIPGTKKSVRMARFIIGENNCKGFEVDHINGDRLDNRKGNLRVVTRQQNAMNVHKNKDVGVSFSRRENGWIAYIGLNGKFIYLGKFNNKLDALFARKNAEKKYFGEFARRD